MEKTAVKANTDCIMCGPPAKEAAVGAGCNPFWSPPALNSTTSSASFANSSHDVAPVEARESEASISMLGELGHAALGDHSVDKSELYEISASGLSSCDTMLSTLSQVGSCQTPHCFWVRSVKVGDSGMEPCVDVESERMKLI
eukprot:CAMPEP_0183406236 /NCGR_PEP_ID=MMETSP0370-20130417/16416_1 /TAXON_ID=268820 /ORGANISM="Peridinium aciculiferum, Strain PAER-2" /LENGTH=142 /DNA_ID=CAMNT_0025588347 /DNA_START=237 /DNA_END=666 /DNA_ORIENTATION=+